MDDLSKHQQKYDQRHQLTAMEVLALDPEMMGKAREAIDRPALVQASQRLDRPQPSTRHRRSDVSGSSAFDDFQDANLISLDLLTAIRETRGLGVWMQHHLWHNAGALGGGTLQMHILQQHSLGLRRRIIGGNCTDVRQYLLWAAVVMASLLMYPRDPLGLVRPWAARLRQNLDSIDESRWRGCEPLYMWLLVFGGMCTEDSSAEQTAFAEDIEGLMLRGSLVGDYEHLDFSSEDDLKEFSEKFFYLDEVHWPLLQALATAIRRLRHQTCGAIQRDSP